MNLERTRALLDRVASGELDSAEALRQLALPDAESLSFATIDHHRALRQGFPEVVFAEGKTVEQVLAIATRLNADGEGFLITRVQPEMWAPLADRFPSAELHQLGRVAYLPPAVASSGADGHGLDHYRGDERSAGGRRGSGVCEAHSARRVERLTDVGVAGIHRLLSRGRAAAVARP